jgi:hypothetical protein
VEWAKSVGGTGNDCFHGVTATSDGGAIAVGSTTATFTVTTLSGNVTVGGKGLNDAMIFKFAANGDVQWAKSVGGAGDESFINRLVAK